ncbi:SLATT domain-containing protein [Stenotrophomonas rhizophila]
MDVLLADQIRQCFGRVVYSHKTHEKMAEHCATTLRHLKIAQIVLSALATCGVLSLFVVDCPVAKAVAALMSFANLAVAGYMKGFDPGGVAQKHRDTAALLWNVRDSYQSLLVDLARGTLSAEAATVRRDELQTATARIYQAAPHTSNKAYTTAQHALKALEDFTFSDGEIDKFLPGSLRKGKDA